MKDLIEPKELFFTYLFGFVLGAFGGGFVTYVFCHLW